MRAITKNFIIRAVTRQLDILECDAKDIACIAKFFPNAMLKCHLKESFATPRCILMSLPINAHALLVCIGPLNCDFVSRNFIRALCKFLDSLLIIGISKCPNASQDQTTFVTFFGPFCLENAFLQNLNGLVCASYTIKGSALVKKISRRAIAIVNVFLQKIKFSLEFGRFVAT